MKRIDQKYCVECGELIRDKAEICPKCGVRQASSEGNKEWMTTLLLCIFLGGIGVHRFYTGHTLIGILQLITLGGCGVWTLIDLILILTNKFKDSNGNLITNN